MRSRYIILLNAAIAALIAECVVYIRIPSNAHFKKNKYSHGVELSIEW